jgi:hypothetical protein
MAKTGETKLSYNEAELSMLKSIFSGNEELLIIIRKLFFGITLSENDKDTIKKTFQNPASREVLRKKVYGLDDYDTPIGQISDFWMGIEQQLFGAPVDTITQAVESKKLVLEMFRKAFLLLENPDGEKVDVSIIPSIQEDPLQVGMIARCLYMKAIETSLTNIKVIAGAKEESIEQAMKRLLKNSAK